MTLLSLAEKFSLTKDWETAASIARVASEVRPNDYEIHRTLGWYLRKAGEPFYGAAERELRQALDLNPGDLEGLGMLGGLLKRAGRYREAAELYARGVGDAPGNLYLRAAHAGVTLLTDPRADSPALDLYQHLLTLCARPERLRDPWASAVAGETFFLLGEDHDALTKFLDVRRSCITAPRV